MPSSSDDNIRILKQLFLANIARPKRGSERPPKQVEPRGSQIVQERIVMPVNDLNECIRMGGEQFLDRDRQDLRIGVRNIADRNSRNNIALRGLHFLHAIMYFAQPDLNAPCKLGSSCVCSHSFCGSVIQATTQLAFKILGRSME